MERAIIKSEGTKEYYFYDCPVWGEDYEKSEVEGVVDTEKETGFHECNKSCLYDDMTGYVDEIQNEEKLPEGNYIVTYYKQIPDDYSGLEQMVDYGITKKQIIENVKAQKYIEGADYFLMKQLKKYHKRPIL